MGFSKALALSLAVSGPVAPEVPVTPGTPTVLEKTNGIQQELRGTLGATTAVSTAEDGDIVKDLQQSLESAKKTQNAVATNLKNFAGVQVELGEFPQFAPKIGGLVGYERQLGILHAQLTDRWMKGQLEVKTARRVIASLDFAREQANELNEEVTKMVKSAAAKVPNQPISLRAPTHIGPDGTIHVIKKDESNQVDHVMFQGGKSKIRNLASADEGVTFGAFVQQGEGMVIRLEFGEKTEHYSLEGKKLPQ